VGELLVSKQFRYKFYIVKVDNALVVKVKVCEGAEPEIDTVTSDDKAGVLS
jgi:hypothetical protein